MLNGLSPCPCEAWSRRSQATEPASLAFHACAQAAHRNVCASESDKLDENQCREFQPAGSQVSRLPFHQASKTCLSWPRIAARRKGAHPASCSARKRNLSSVAVCDPISCGITIPRL